VRPAERERRDRGRRVVPDAGKCAQLVVPVALAAEPAGEAVRAWGRLGYPRRALRLHAAARLVVDRHGGQLPESYAELRSLPGVGDYTAAAVASFAHEQRHAVLDTNVRRVLARVVAGDEFPAAPTVSGVERGRAEGLLPERADEAASWAVAVMELGALVCTATSPDCARCPVRDLCAWRAAGAPPYQGPARRTQTYAGTDRQCRGRLLAVLRDADGPVRRASLDAAWHLPDQRDRCLASLVADGLAVEVAAGHFALP
jgi:A/G-specific adenine glycosylase